VASLGEVVLLWLLGLGCSGFVIGSLVVLTMPAPAALRLVAGVVVFMASVIGVGLVLIGVLRPPFWFFAIPLLVPVLTALGVRYIWSRGRKPDGYDRDVTTDRAVD